MNTPPEDEWCSVPRTFAKSDWDLISGKEAAITASWERLLERLRDEVRVVEDTGAAIIPSIDFEELK